MEQKIAVWPNNEYAVVANLWANQVVIFNSDHTLRETVAMPDNLTVKSLHSFVSRTNQNVLLILTNQGDVLYFGKANPEEDDLTWFKKLDEQFYKLQLIMSGSAQPAKIKTLSTFGYLYAENIVYLLVMVTQTNKILISARTEGKAVTLDVSDDTVSAIRSFELSDIPTKKKDGSLTSIKNVFLGNGFLLVLTEAGEVFLRYNKDNHNATALISSLDYLDGITVTDFGRNWKKINFYHQSGTTHVHKIVDIVVAGTKFWALAKDGAVFDSDAKCQLININTNHIASHEQNLYWLQDARVNIREVVDSVPRRTIIPTAQFTDRDIISMHSTKDNLLILKRSQDASDQNFLIEVLSAKQGRTIKIIHFDSKTKNSNIALWRNGDLAMVVNNLLYLYGTDPEEKEHSQFGEYFPAGTQEKYLSIFNFERDDGRLFSGEHANGKALFVLVNQELYGCGILAPYKLGVSDLTRFVRVALPAKDIEDIGLYQNSVIMVGKTGHLYCNQLAVEHYEFDTVGAREHVFFQIKLQFLLETKFNKAKVVLGNNFIYILVDGKVYVRFARIGAASFHNVNFRILPNAVGWYQLLIPSSTINEVTVTESQDGVDSVWALTEDGRLFFIAINNVLPVDTQSKALDSKITKIVSLENKQIIYRRANGLIYKYSLGKQEECISSDPKLQLYSDPVSAGNHYVFVVQKTVPAGGDGQPEMCFLNLLGSIPPKTITYSGAEVVYSPRAVSPIGSPAAGSSRYGAAFSAAPSLPAAAVRPTPVVAQPYLQAGATGITFVNPFLNKENCMEVLPVPLSGLQSEYYSEVEGDERLSSVHEYSQVEGRETPPPSMTSASEYAYASPGRVAAAEAAAVNLYLDVDGTVTNFGSRPSTPPGLVPGGAVSANTTPPRRRRLLPQVPPSSSGRLLPQVPPSSPGRLLPQVPPSSPGRLLPQGPPNSPRRLTD